MVLAYYGGGELGLHEDQAMARSRWCALLAALMLLNTAALTGCRSNQKSEDDAASGAVTAGMVKKTVAKGETTQTEVLEIFGPPDLLTYKDGNEVWTYDKTTYDIERTSGYFTVLLAGGDRKHVRSSSRSTMVIIYFDENDVVRDFRLSVVRY
jgi:outer membrane protein assembly factor BamE (lipoprotein component of BamABCDE complex)